MSDIEKKIFKGMFVTSNFISGPGPITTGEYRTLEFSNPYPPKENQHKQAFRFSEVEKREEREGKYIIFETKFSSCLKKGDWYLVEYTEPRADGHGYYYPLIADLCDPPTQKENETNEKRLRKEKAYLRIKELELEKKQLEELLKS